MWFYTQQQAFAYLYSIMSYLGLVIPFYFYLLHNKVVLFDNPGCMLMLKYECVRWINDIHDAVNLWRLHTEREMIYVL